MKTVLVFAGTTEGRELVEIFDRSGIRAHVCVATEYGSQILKTSDNITVHEGRLDEEGMRKLYDQIGCDVVVDATHPYAVVVTSLIKKSIENTDITYIRLQRDNNVQADSDKMNTYDSVEQCAMALTKTTGRILLTTGSKQLADFTSFHELKSRIIARVIPGMESLKLCYEAGLEGSQIIAMQGPFSCEMNEAVIKDYKIEHLVTKESGVTGGVNDKFEAADRQGIALHVIKRPDDPANIVGNDAFSKEETISRLEELLGVSFVRGKLQIVLAGIGPGSTKMMTKEVEEEIRNADVVFGAKRMIDSIEGTAKTYPYYLKEDIMPVLTKLSQESCSDTKAVILFSGDSGFYSGCSKMYEALAENGEWDIRIMPGISSVSALSARIGIDWQNGNILSLHGTRKEDWIPKIVESVKHNKKTFFITSGVKDIHLLGELLKDREGIEIKLGYQISYPEEKIMTLSSKECMELNDEGLYTGVILSGNIDAKYLVPVLEDEFFIRDKVPMTKEEVRKLSICQMKLKENDIVYDIGCGSGSIAVQAGMLSSDIRVFAIECNPDAVELTKKNIKKAQLYNIEVIEAMAPDGLDNLPAADVAFVGGSRGNLKDILQKLYRINSSMRVVINAVSMETICEMNSILNTLEVKNISIEQIAVSKANKLGDYHMLSANNPVFVFSFDFEEKVE